jgi:hypothetical protein
MSRAIRHIVSFAVGLACALAFVPLATAVVPPMPGPNGPEAKMAALLAAIRKSDYAALAANPDWVQNTGTKVQFDSAESAIGTRLRKPYRLTPLGEIKKDGGQQVSLWRIRFADGGNEALVMLLTKGDKVTGFSVN